MTSKPRRDPPRNANGERRPAPTLQLPMIEELLASDGDITLGRIGPVPCGATAAHEGNVLAMLVRRRGESLAALLKRLDDAIKSAWDDEDFIDEVNPRG